MRDSSLTYTEGSIFKQLAEAAIKYRTQEISDEVMAFEPEEDDKFETISDGSYVRRVYYKQELRERERQGVDEFREWARANNKPVPEGMLDDHNYELRFLNLNNYNNEKALDEMIQNDAWMRESALARFEDPGERLMGVLS